MAKINVYIVDDHEMFREGVKMLLAKSDDFEIVGVASNGKQCIENIPDKTDIVLMDISMPEMDGIETTQNLIKINPFLKIIALSMFGDEEYYYKMVHSGVKGFILKESGSRELEDAIRAVYKGQNFFSQELLRNIIINFGDNKTIAKKPNESLLVTFTDREIEILQKICSGLTNKEIADDLNISLRTVESHKSKLIHKTEVKNTVGLVMYAIKNDLIKVN